MKFEEILTIAIFITGMVLLLDLLFFKARRAAKYGTAPAQGANNAPAQVANSAQRQEINNAQRQEINNPQRQGANSAQLPWWVEYAQAFFPVLLLVFVLRSFVAEPFRIPSGSMKPTLLVGDFILVNKYNYGLRVPILGNVIVPVGKPKRGDVIVFRHSNRKDLIKRVVGLPGDRITYRDKVLYINNNPVVLTEGRPAVDGITPAFFQREALDEKTHDIYTYPQVKRSYYPVNDVIVPEDSYFVMGDNRDGSEDSRFWGFVSDRSIIGRAVATWLSWDWQAWNKISVRWNRLFKSIE